MSLNFPPDQRQRLQEPDTNISFTDWSALKASKEPHVLPTLSLTCNGTKRTHYRTMNKHTIQYELIIAKM